MIDFLESKAGRWLFRLLALATSFAVLTQGLGLAWHGEGEPFLIAMFTVMLLCGVVALDLFLSAALSIAPAAGFKGTPRYPREIPALSSAKQLQVQKLVRAMAKAGVFTPEVPEPHLAFPAFAVGSQRIGWVSVMQALAEADYYLPNCDPARWSENLVWSELPADWQEPPEGKVLAFLWQDETVIFSRVNADAMAKLAEPAGDDEGWSAFTADVLPVLREAGVRIR